MIRKTLVLLKPCQASELRYAFPDKHQSKSADTMVVYFEPQLPHSYPHVLWTANMMYKPDTGEEQPFDYKKLPRPKGIGTAYEVKKTIDC